MLLPPYLTQTCDLSGDLPAGQILGELPRRDQHRELFFWRIAEYHGNLFELIVGKVNDLDL